MFKKAIISTFAAVAVMIASQAPASAAMAVSKPTADIVTASSDLIQVRGRRGGRGFRGGGFRKRSGGFRPRGGQRRDSQHSWRKWNPRRPVQGKRNSGFRPRGSHLRDSQHSWRKWSPRRRVDQGRKRYAPPVQQITTDDLVRWQSPCGAYC